MTRVLAAILASMALAGCTVASAQTTQHHPAAVVVVVGRPVCRVLQLPGHPGVCQALPPRPPVVSAAACHMTRAAWHQYMRQLAIGGHGRDAHCWTRSGQLLNRVWVYNEHPGMWRPDGTPSRVLAGRTDG